MSGFMFLAAAVPFPVRDDTGVVPMTVREAQNANLAPPAGFIWDTMDPDGLLIHAACEEDLDELVIRPMAVVPPEMAAWGTYLYEITFRFTPRRGAALCQYLLEQLPAGQEIRLGQLWLGTMSPGSLLVCVPQI